jgi:uncharacterized protein (DUF342 family)
MNYSPFVMRQLRKGFEVGIDLTDYTGYGIGVMRQIRKAAMAEVDIIPYVEQGYDAEQLEAIRMALSAHVEIEPYLQPAYHGSCIREISLGLQHGLDVSVYADRKFSWRKMREIRLGLEHDVDVYSYMNPQYSYRQMQEIRLGLEEGLDVSVYKSLMLTAAAMRRKRLEMELPVSEIEDSNKYYTMEHDCYRLHIGRDGMHVFLEITDVIWKPTIGSLRQILKSNGIVYGVDDVELAGIETHVDVENKQLLIASGAQPENGVDGYYVWNVERNLNVMPREKADGSGDFQSITWFERVAKGQTLATYYPATAGKEGMTVKGEKIPALDGKEQPRLTGTGFHVLEDGRTYVADRDGRVIIKGLQMAVEELLVLESLDAEAPEDIVFDGSIHIRGNIENSHNISAAGDIIVDGYIKDSCLKSGGNILVRRGMNSVVGGGRLKAAGNILGGYFESVELEAGKNIYFTSSLNSDLKAGGGIITFGSKGGIVGGSAYAERGFCISGAGNEMGKATSLMIGYNDQMLIECDELRRQQEETDEEMQKLELLYKEMCHQFTETQRRGMETFTKLENTFFVTIEQRKKLIARKKELTLEMERALDAQIIVDGMLYPNVAVSVNGMQFYPGQAEHIAIRQKNRKLCMEEMYA